jgi:hypothetical protein
MIFMYESISMPLVYKAKQYDLNEVSFVKISLRQLTCYGEVYTILFLGLSLCKCK